MTVFEHTIRTRTCSYGGAVYFFVNLYLYLILVHVQPNSYVYLYFHGVASFVYCDGGRGSSTRVFRPDRHNDNNLALEQWALGPNPEGGIDYAFKNLNL